jgi:hypothetical protein
MQHPFTSNRPSGQYLLLQMVNTRSQVGVLRVNNRNHLVCNADGQSFIWNIDPRGSDAYMFVSFASLHLILIETEGRIGDAANALAIQLPINASGPVRIYLHSMDVIKTVVIHRL